MMPKVTFPFWKKWMSYVTEIHVETSSSDYNEFLEVTLSKGRLQLSTREAIYSYADKYDNFRETFQKMKLPDEAQVLLLGFGLGSIPFMLEKKFHKMYSYTGVEIDDAVIYLASKYVLPDVISDIHLIQADACSYVHQDTNRYDIIAMDIFISEKIPAPFETKEFLENLQKNLTDSGILLFNRLAKTKTEIEATEKYINHVFLPVFPNATFNPVKGNYVLISNKSALI
ncbi:MAG: fused MFS/spermidine synthase [Saprospiraceae bacterium]|nr:fused MFS/spermidine synthase [Saprospiraceae bacterium]MBK8819975.1 fused MFS/spermidine synthase [Saprospiraceae bacterium]